MDKSKKFRVEAAVPLFAYRKKIHIRLDDNLHKKLRMKVADEGTTIQNYITKLLTTALGASPAAPDSVPDKAPGKVPPPAVEDPGRVE